MRRFMFLFIVVVVVVSGCTDIPIRDARHQRAPHATPRP